MPIRLATKAAAEAAEPSRSRPLGPGMDLDISSVGILQKKTIRGHLNLNNLNRFSLASFAWFLLDVYLRGTYIEE